MVFELEAQHALFGANCASTVSIGSIVVNNFLSVTSGFRYQDYGFFVEQALVLMPVLNGKMIFYAFETTPETMVEPRRQCYSLSSVNLRKKAVGGILFVTVISASILTRSNMKGSPSRRQGSSLMDATLEENKENKVLQTFIEVELGELTRRTYASPGSSPRWDTTFNMVLHGDIGSLKFNLYKSFPICVKYDFLTSLEIKLKYVDDDSTIFWVVGHGSSELVKHAERIGEKWDVSAELSDLPMGKWAASDMNAKLQRRKRWINELSHFLSIMLNSINNFLKNCSSSRKVI
ncbi:hypothetical protein AAG906_007584 [Vitis piasezkii]